MSVYCTFCGGKFEQSPGPLVQSVRCQGSECGRVVWLNPKPVALVILPVEDGLLLIRRVKEPMPNQLAFPGGYVERGETAETAARRELYEETGVELGERDLSYFASHATVQGRLLLFFAGRPMQRNQLPPFRPNAEASERVIVNEVVFLAFHTHREMMEKFFSERDLRT